MHQDVLDWFISTLSLGLRDRQIDYCLLLQNLQKHYFFCVYRSSQQLGARQQNMLSQLFLVHNKNRGGGRSLREANWKAPGSGEGEGGERKGPKAYTHDDRNLLELQLVFIFKQNVSITDVTFGSYNNFFRICWVLKLLTPWQFSDLCIL